MAGIGVKLTKIYKKRTLLALTAGLVYSTVVTIAPMLVVILTIWAMGYFLGYDSIGYARRELFACTVLYIFVFSLLTAAPFNPVLSRYMSDVIYEERYDDIMPCFYTGLVMNMIPAAALGFPFALHEYRVGGVAADFVLLSLIGYFGLVFIFYAMLYLFICKDYSKVTGFYCIGMAVTLLASWVMVRLFKVELVWGMLCALDMGILVIAGLELAQLRQYFRENSRRYFRVLPYFGKYWYLAVSNFLYVLGLYVHNFVFWNSDLQMRVVNTFICAQPYDMATFLALLTNITSTVIFISSVEMNFHNRYKEYSESVIGGTLSYIEKSEERIFRQLRAELMNLVRVQFIISVVLFLAFIVALPLFGFSGLVMQIYPCLAAGYYVLFLMYAGLIFLYYFNDLHGAVLSSLVFCAVTWGASLLLTRAPVIWYGLGLFLGALTGWTVIYHRLHWLERHLDRHIFCKGRLMKPVMKQRPTDLVYSREKGYLK